MAKRTTQSVVPDEVHTLANQIGDFIQYWGFRKVEGRLWTYLFLAKKPLKAEELLERSGISKAMLSLSLNELLKYDVIRKAYPERERGQAYVANPNVMEVISNVLRTRERHILGKIQSSFVCVQKNPEEIQKLDLNSERLNFLGQMIGAATQLLDSLLSMQALDILPFQMVQCAPPIETTKPEKKSKFSDKVVKL